jgi:hypothetical protein
MKEIILFPPAPGGGGGSLPCNSRNPSVSLSTLLLLLLPLLLLLVAAPARASQIADYKVLRQVVDDRRGHISLATRSFKSDGKESLLVVDPETLQSAVLPAASVRFSAIPAESALASTRFLKELHKTTSGPYRLQNDGATRADTAVKGSFLTVDLCPSKRPFEREMFDAVGGLTKGKPVPVAVSISGIWLTKHPEELAYLKKEVAAGRLAITWVNHSFHHPYEPKAPLQRNFLLTPGTDLTAEVLGVEKELLAHDLVPSPFFRFPGLVSDRQTMLRLRELSLIPIGSDAWLAKGESPRDGSFILVHGNGNEPKGIRLLMPMLKGKELRLLPLASGFGG